MKYWLLGVLLSLSFPSVGAERTLVVLGDSLSAAFGIPADKGWVHLLTQRLRERQPEWSVVNASISGDTTAGGLARLPPLLERHRPSVVVIELGSNDGLRGFGFAQIRANLAAMIEAARQSGAGVLLVGGRLPPNYGAAYADAFHQLFKQLATEHGVALVPFLMAGVAEGRSLMLPDGYHPAAQAQPLLLANVWPALLRLLESSGN